MRGGSPTTVLLGRDDSLGRLAAIADRVAHEAPAVVVVSGETGVGKTALLRRFLRDLPFVPLVGSCVPVAGHALPFAPLTQALRSLRATPWADRVRPAPELLRLAPAEAGDAPQPEHGSSQLRLFEAVLEQLQQLSRIRPVVHAVEDLHWADRSTLDLLRFLAGNLSTERVLLLLTYRTDEPESEVPLQPWLAELHRLPLTEEVELQRLGAADTRSLVERLAGDRPPSDLVESALSRSAGNPLFVEHLVGSLSCGDPGLPSTLRELLRARVTRHDATTRRMLRAVSVVGRVTPLPVLASMAERPMEEVEDALRPAFEHHLLELRDGDAVGFRHPALREVVYAELLPGERARWHRAAARALAAGSDADPATAAEVARHWHLAGDVREALVASVRAGFAAERIYAHDDARASFTRAAELLDRVPAEDRAADPALDSLSHPHLLAHAAQAASLIGEHEEAVRLTTAALTRAEPGHRTQLLERLGAFEFIAGRGDRAEGALREALSLLPPGEVTPLAVRVHAWLALLAAAWSRFDEARAVGETALAMARRTGARREEGIALDALGITAAACGEPVAGATLLREALAAARDHGSPDDIAIVYVNLTHVLGQANLLAEAVEVGREGLEAVRRSGLLRQYGGLLMSNVGEQLIESGRLDEAEELVARALTDLPRGIQAGPALLQSGRLAMVRGDLRLARERCEQARVAIESESSPDSWQREAYETLAEVELWSGRPAAAYEVVMDGLATCCGGDERRFGGLLVMLGLRAIGDQAELVRGHRQRSRRQELDQRHEELMRVVRRLEVDPFDPAAGSAGGTPESVPVALTCRAELARCEGRDGVAAWTAAAAAWASAGRPFQEGWSRWREAEARLARGVDAAGVGALRTAAARASALDARGLAGELSALAALYRVDLLPSQPPADASGAAAAPDPALASLGLTAREREVLAALGAGWTNHEIAVALFISEKTASVHVSNILRKLDVSGRQEAGRIAHRLGMGHPAAR